MLTVVSEFIVQIHGVTDHITITKIDNHTSEEKYIT